VSSARAPAKLNLTLVVGPRRPDGKHEVATVLQRLALADTIELEPAGELGVEGFPEDTHVRGALEALAERAGVQPHWHARITKEIPVAAGLGGGSARSTAPPRRGCQESLVITPSQASAQSSASTARSGSPTAAARSAKNSGPRARRAAAIALPSMIAASVTACRPIGKSASIARPDGDRRAGWRSARRP
jgi:hypothetical protein